MTVHLNVLHPTDGKTNPSQAARLYNPQRFDFRWNDDFTAFQPLPLTWWDDASYLAYQARG